MEGAGQFSVYLTERWLPRLINGFTLRVCFLIDGFGGPVLIVTKVKGVSVS